MSDSCTVSKFKVATAGLKYWCWEHIDTNLWHFFGMYN